MDRGLDYAGDLGTSPGRAGDRFRVIHLAEPIVIRLMFRIGREIAGILQQPHQVYRGWGGIPSWIRRLRGAQHSHQWKVRSTFTERSDLYISEKVREIAAGKNRRNLWERDHPACGMFKPSRRCQDCFRRILAIPR